MNYALLSIICWKIGQRKNFNEYKEEIHTKKHMTKLFKLGCKLLGKHFTFALVMK